MKKGNLILEKSYTLSLQMMRICKKIRDLHEYELASQLWRSGTSIGANIEDAQETPHWFRLTRDGGILPTEDVTPLLAESDSIRRILTSIVKSSGK